MLDKAYKLWILNGEYNAISRAKDNVEATDVYSEGRCSGSLSLALGDTIKTNKTQALMRRHADCWVRDRNLEPSRNQNASILLGNALYRIGQAIVQAKEE